MLSRFFEELRRRHVPQAVGLYLAGGWISFEVADSTFVRLGLPDWTVTFVLALIIAGLPVAVAVAWFFDFKRDGLHATPSAEPVRQAIPSAAVSGSRSRRSAVLAGAAIVGVVLAGAAVWAGRSTSAPPTPVAENAMVVFPFTVRGGEEARVLAEGMVGLLSRKLDGVDDIRAVDPNTILGRVSGEVEPAAARELAQELGASYYLLGSVLEFGGSLSLEVSVYATGGDNGSLANAAVEGRAEAFPELVDELAAQLLVDGEFAPSGTMPGTAVLTTSEYPALKFFVEGERAFRGRNFEEAIEQFESAIEADSAFALAHYRMAVAARWDERPERAVRAIALAWRYRDRLSPRDRDRLAAFEAWDSGRMVEAKERYESILASHPADAEAWYELGEVFLHSGPTLGIPVAEAREPFETVAELDPGHVPALDHLSMIAAWTRDSTTLDMVTTQLRQLLDDFPVIYEAQWAFMMGDSIAREQAVDAAIRENSSIGLIYGSWSTDDLEEMSRIVGVVDRLPGGWWDWAFASGLAGIGQREAALDWIDVRTAGDPDGLARTALLATVPYLPPQVDRLESLRELLETWDPGPIHTGPLTAADRRELGAVLPQARVYLLGLAAHLQGRSADALLRADELDAMPGADGIRVLARDLARHIRAEVGFASGRPAEALALLEEMTVWDEAVWDTRFSMLFTFSGPVMLRGDVLFELGRYREALRWFGTYSLAPYPFGYAWYRRGRTYEELGETDRAAEFYANFVRRWAEADPDLQPLVVDARQRLKALTE